MQDRCLQIVRYITRLDRGQAGDGMNGFQGFNREDRTNGLRADRGERAKAYFSRPGFERPLQAVWDRYASFGKARGNAVVRNATPEECEMVNSFMGWNVKPGGDIRLPLAAFERELLESAFAMTIEELHAVLTGEPLLTKSDRQQLDRQEWEELFRIVKGKLEREEGLLHPVVADWLEQLKAGKADGYRMLRELWRQYAQDAERELANAAAAWNLLLARHLGSEQRLEQSSMQSIEPLLGGLRSDDSRLDGSLDRSGPASPSDGLHPIRLPVLAALATGNPHALDRNVPAGRLLFQALRVSARRAVPEPGQDQESEVRCRADQIGQMGLISQVDRTGQAVNAADSAEAIAGSDSDSAFESESAGTPERDSSIEEPEASAIEADSLASREIYRVAGIADDDISTLVHVFIPWESGGLSILSLRQIERMKKVPFAGDLYVVENPAVFSTLIDMTERWLEKGGAFRLSVDGPALLCTSGPASAAALRLLDRYVQEGPRCGTLYYSGDFDVKGIEIGNVLAARYRGQFRPWRFDSQSYAAGSRSSNREGVRFSDEECNRLKQMGAVWDDSLCRAMSGIGRKLFQEEQIAFYMEDWMCALEHAGVSDSSK